MNIETQKTISKNPTRTSSRFRIHASRSMSGGFTFIELIIYVAVLGLIAVSFGSLAISISGATGSASGSVDLVSSLSMVLDEFSDAFAVASSVSYPTTGNTDSYLALVHADTGEIMTFGRSGNTLVRGVNGLASTTITDPGIITESVQFVHRNSGGARDHVGVSFTGRADNSSGNALVIPITSSFITGQ